MVDLVLDKVPFELGDRNLQSIRRGHLHKICTRTRTRPGWKRTAFVGPTAPHTGPGKPG